MKTAFAGAMTLVVLLGVCIIGFWHVPVAAAQYRPPVLLSKEKCEVHKTYLWNGMAPVLYGLRTFKPSYLINAPKLFPNANTFVLGGCLLRDQQQESVLYCSKCRRALGKWEEEYGKNGKQLDEQAMQEVLKRVEEAEKTSHKK